ncbi:hypothetical protein H4R19_000928 [Coemansia spiralis]|nr:hypothetical protein H4R19_000928 [Coemansia spiralis]
MQLLDLPAEILTEVLRRSLSDPDEGVWLELNLPLVAVCRRLRYIALPLVYKEAYMDAFDYDTSWRDKFNVDLSRGKRRHRAPSHQGAHGHWVAVSNVDLIVSLGYTGLVKHMGIAIASGYGHVVGLRLVVRHLCNAASEWPTVQRLDISMSEPTVSRPIGYEVEDSDRSNEFAKHALALRAMLPNACELCFEDIRILPDPTFGVQLTQHYHQQLRMLHFDAPADVPPNISFPQLRDLHFAGTGSFPDCIPRVDAAKLECLKLHRVHPFHSWAAFGADNSGRVLEFSALMSLDVDFWSGINIGSASASQDGCNLKLSFPLLRSARIHCSSGPCPELASAVFPRSMGSLDIQVSAPVWQSISHMELPVATRLKLGIPWTTNSDTRLPLSFNQLLANSHQCREVTMRAYSHDPLSFFPGIAFTGLTGLAVEEPISADMLLDIIGKLPRLVTLVATRSTRDPIQADIAIPGPGKCHPIEPLGAKLQRLSYGQEDTRELSRANIELYQYLLLKLPSLQSFGAGDHREKKLKAFVKTHRKWYPHLAGVNFGCIEYRGI